MARFAITGGTGFVGATLIEAALAAGHTVQALARSKQRPQPRLTWIHGALADSAAMTALAKGADAFIHVAGVVNARTARDFDHGNVAGTRAALDAAAAVPRFVHVSSLAARAPALSVYGSSKAAADALVMAARPDAAIIRPPAVYGPRDRDMARLYRLVAKGVAPVLTSGRFSIIEVSDLARALLMMATSDAEGIYEIDDGTPGGLSHRQLAAHIADAVGRAPLYIPMPAGLLSVGAAFETAIARIRGGLPVLSFDRARYLAHPDWVADSTPLRRLGLWSPQLNPAEGIARTAVWYRAAGWI